MSESSIAYLTKLSRAVPLAEINKLENDVMHVLNCIYHSGNLVLYGLFLFLKYLCLFLYYTIVDGVWSLFSLNFLPKHPIWGLKVMICGVGDKFVKCLALKIAHCGVYLILWDSSKNKIDKTVEYLQAQGINRVRGYVVDFNSKEDIFEKASQLNADYEEPDIVFNNLLEADNGSTFCRMDNMAAQPPNTSVSLHNIINAFLPGMLRRNKGHIVTLTSVYGFIGCSFRARLSAESHSVVGMMESLRLNLKQTGIRTSIICSTPLKSPENAARRPWLLHPLNPEFLAKNIIRAIEIGQETVILPRCFCVLRFLRNIAPTRFTDLVFENIIDDAYRET